MNSESGFQNVSCDLCGADDCRRVLEKDQAFYVECARCGFVYANPRIADAEEFNEEIFKERLGKYVAKNFSKKKQRDYERELRLLEPYRGGGRLLEVGSNVGGFLLPARERGWDVTGVEPVAACARYGREERGLNILPVTLEAADLPANHFDVVYSNAVFEHLPSPTSCFRAAHRVLRPGGVLYVDTVNYHCYTRDYLGERWKLLKPREHLSLFSPATLRAFCEKTGFRVLKVRTHGIRFRSNLEGRLTGLRRLREELMKLPVSIAARVRLRGDSIAALAMKTE
jgi:2-polyprenyl-3-methyl-5-hydroxy-6-metoxy-1,4-benzoquinol methylase